jgi:hypothetical protein
MVPEGDGNKHIYRKNSNSHMDHRSEVFANILDPSINAAGTSCSGWT